MEKIEPRRCVDTFRRGPLLSRVSRNNNAQAGEHYLLLGVCMVMVNVLHGVRPLIAASSDAGSGMSYTTFNRVDLTLITLHRL